MENRRDRLERIAFRNWRERMFVELKTAMGGYPPSRALVFAVTHRRKRIHMKRFTNNSRRMRYVWAHGIPGYHYQRQALLSRV